MGKTLKNILKVTGLCAISAIAGAYLLHSIEKETSINPSSNYKNQKIELQSPNVLLNRDDGVSFVMNKNEEQGIEDIKKIINNSDYEESWLYLPEKQKWCEVGIESDSDFVVMSLPRIYKTLEENKNVKELIFYHNHPLNSSKNPSFTDLTALIKLTKIFPDYKIKEKICSEYGITEYSLTEKAIKEFKLKEIINIKNYYTDNKTNDRVSINFNPEYLNIAFKPFEDTIK